MNSTSNFYRIPNLGDEHCDRKGGSRIHKLIVTSRYIAILGMDELSREDKLVVCVLEKLEGFPVYSLSS